MRIGCTLFLFLFSHLFTSAWNACGHMMVAAIAFQEMTEEQQAVITEILIRHPEYDRRWKADYQKLTDEIEVGLYLFMRAGVWPDEIADQNHPDHLHHAPRWHYINFKLKFLFNERMGEIDQVNVLQAIKTNLSIYNSEATLPEHKAIVLSWLIHLVADIHQPLHVVSLYSYKFPDGDRGGNRFWIKDNDPVNLHAYWDGLFGQSTEAAEVLNKAAIIKSHFPKNEDAQELNPKIWGLESFKLAREKVYYRGRLRSGTSKENAHQIPENYGKESRKVGEKRVVQAGYRLAGILSSSAEQ